ncbi:MAG: DUF488 domain-containing protein [Candidatus Promineifilaceae bacterium]
MIAIKRVYDKAKPEDGRRFLVERLWPRGVAKDRLAAEWVKEVAPSPELRRWFGHDPEKWDDFQRRYRRELDENGAGWRPLLAAARHGRITLVYAARDEAHNSALLLKEYLDQRLEEGEG